MGNIDDDNCLVEREGGGRYSGLKRGQTNLLYHESDSRYYKDSTRSPLPDSEVTYLQNHCAKTDQVTA